MRVCLKSAIEYIRALPSDDSNYFKNLQELADKGKIALKKWESFESKFVRIEFVKSNKVTYKSYYIRQFK